MCSRYSLTFATDAIRDLFAAKGELRSPRYNIAPTDPEGSCAFDLRHDEFALRRGLLPTWVKLTRRVRDADQRRFRKPPPKNRRFAARCAIAGVWFRPMAPDEWTGPTGETVASPDPDAVKTRHLRWPDCGSTGSAPMAAKSTPWRS